MPSESLQRLASAFHSEEALPYILAAIMEASTDLCFAKDKNFTYLCCSKTFARLVGQTDEGGVVGKTDYDLFPREIAEKYRADDLRLMRIGEALVDMVETIPSEDGVRRYSSTSKYPLRNCQGELIGLYGVGRDITEHREAYAQLKLLTDSIPGGLGMYELSPRGTRLLYCSDGFFSITGYTREEYAAIAQGDPFHLVFPEDLPVIRQNIAAVLSGADHFDYMYRAHRKEGGFNWINLRGNVSERHEDQVIVNTVKLDVTEQKKVEEQLRMSEEQCRLALLHSGTIMFRYDVADRSANMTREVADLFAAPPKIKNVPYGPVRDGLIAPECAEAYVGFYEGILRGKRTGAASFRCRTVNGWRWMKANQSTIFDDAGRPVYAVVSYVDSTENHEKELAYERYRQTICQNTNADGGLVYFEADLTADINEKSGGSMLPAELLSRYGSRSAMLEYALNHFMSEDERARCRRSFSREQLMRRYQEGVRNLNEEWQIIVRDGAHKYFRSETQLVQDPYTGHIKAYTIMRDITEEKQAELDFKKQAETDGMTGLYNKATTEALVRRALGRAEGQHCAMLIADLDDLKSVNDTLGHPHGDAVIRLLANVLQNQFRRTDIVGRIGGDEFLVLLDGISDRVRLDCMLRSLYERLAALEAEGENVGPLDASIGVAVSCAGGATFEALYAQADQALYRAKRNGKRQYAFYMPEDE